MTPAPKFTGCRACPSMESVKAAIAITRESAFQFGQMDLQSPLPNDFVRTYNRAILYLLWHQFFAIATRGIRFSYIALGEVSSISGIATLTDKDTGTGHKTRLVWMSPALLEHIRRVELSVEEVRVKLAVERGMEEAAIFFLDTALQAVDVTPTSINSIASEFFPFPANTPRRIARLSLCEVSLPNEMVDTYMGHWRERQEPWGRWSSFDYAVYIERLRSVIPPLLHGLGFEVPPIRRTHGRRTEK